MNGFESEPLIVIQKSQATFRMDGNGRWHNNEGPFRHKRIIELFNAVIRKDEGGYFVTQDNGVSIEKVYFPYEETALFVVELIWGDPDRIRLNTGRVLTLDPGSLFIHQDSLYCRLGDGVAKFNQNALMAVSKALTCDNGRYCFTTGSERIVLDESPAIG